VALIVLIANATEAQTRQVRDNSICQKWPLGHTYR